LEKNAMNTKWMLLVMGSASGIALAATLVHGADLRPMVVRNVTGNLHIVQQVPCDMLTKDTPVTQGRIVITPAEGIDVAGGKSFELIGFTISFAPFTMSDSCRGFEFSRTYNLLSVQLRKVVAFIASDRGGGVFSVTIPKDQFLIYETAVVDGRSLEKAYQHPSQDVTGTIDLARGTAAMRVMVARTIHFEEGCADRPCTIDEDDPGTLTLTLSGTIAFPDSDGDGVPDRSDNCVFVANPDQSPVATPTIVAPSALTLSSCTDPHIGAARAADVCDGGRVSITNDAPGMFVPGSTIVIWTARDQKQRTATATQTVTVVDATPPVFSLVPPDITRNDCGSVVLGVPAAADDCGGTVTFRNNAPASFGAGETPVTWTATDVSGNRATAVQIVSVHDTAPPALSCVSVQPPGGSFQVAAADACGALTIRLGGFTIANGEVIKIDETGQAGVTLVNVVDGVRHFHVGKGEGVIVATDGSGNIAAAQCR
jgi:hypothetical protein